MSRSSPKESFYKWDGDTLVLNVQGKPGARQNKFGRVMGKQLQVHVAESPEKGKATARLVAFLAEEFGVSKSAITVVFGEHSVNKQLRIASPQKLPEGIFQQPG